MIIRGPILNPRADGTIDFIPDGILQGVINIGFIGSFDEFKKRTDFEQLKSTITQSTGIIVPTFLDAHIHIPQHPIRGRFTEGVVGDPPEGRLLAGLNRNVFPVEGKCSDPDYARATIESFLKDTLAQGVVGGAAFMTVHPRAAQAAMEILPDTWSAGLVLMNQNCPEYLRNDASTIDGDLRALADEFGDRSIITDRFAVACSTDLRRLGVAVAKDCRLRTQTHLNEQIREKSFVESSLYPQHKSYTDVYRQDGLLDHQPLLAHCIHMTADEWQMLSDSRASVLHCPTSNMLLGSGVMNLAEVKSRGIDYAICTDVGASPTTSMLMEMAQFVLSHKHTGIDADLLATEALHRSTLAPARILKLDQHLGSFEIGKTMSFIEVSTDHSNFTSASDAITAGLLGHDSVSPETIQTISHLSQNLPAATAELERLSVETRHRAAKFEQRIIRVVHQGGEVFLRHSTQR